MRFGAGGTKQAESNSIHTGSEMLGSGIDEVHEASTTVELGEEDGSIGLGFRVLDPLETRSDAAVLTAALAKDPTTVAAHPHGYFFFS